ncbi:MAG: hypothetical protein GY782_08005, partial [Gammaproteobacteria bacterium]|nr:hypothetical protein [Gammaproteobacteria bacterium]
DGKIIEKEIAEIKSTAKEYLYNIKTQIKSQNKFIIFLQSKVKQLENDNVELAKTIKQQSEELAETKARLIESEKEKNVLIKQHSENMKKVNESNINNINKMQSENMSKTKVLMDKYLNYINDLENKVKFQDKKKQNELDELSNELAISRKTAVIQIKVKEAAKKEWYPGYSKAGKFGAFLVDFVLIIPPLMNLVGWIFSGFGLVKEFHTIMHETAVNDYEKELLCEMNKESEIYDVIKRKNSLSYQNILDGLENDIGDSAANNNDKPTKIVKTLVQSSVVIGAENNNDLPSNATTPEPKTYVIQ